MSLFSRFKRYRWKNRIVLVDTPNYHDPNYLFAKGEFIKRFKDFENRFVVMVSNVGHPFRVRLIGFDGKVKRTYKNFSVRQILSDIESMPMGSLRKY